jgi:hypothetical protein
MVPSSSFLGEWKEGYTGKNRYWYRGIGRGIDGGIGDGIGGIDGRRACLKPTES